MNVANVATLDIPVAKLIPHEQVFNHVSQFNILVYFLYFYLKRLFLSYQPLSLSLNYGICGFSGGEASGGRGGYILYLVIFNK